MPLRDYLNNSKAILESIPERLEKLRFGMGWDSGCTDPPIYDIRDLMQSLALTAIYEAERGNARAAGEALKKGFDVAMAVTDNSAATTMMRCACATLMCDATEQALSRTVFDTPALLYLERRIRPELVGNFENALIGDRYVGLVFWMNIG